MNEPITLTPHLGDRARDAYWEHPTAFNLAALFIAAVAFGIAVVVII